MRGHMTPDRWKRIKELVGLTLEHELQTRGAFLAEMCADDTALRAEVESLVAAHERDPSFIETPALSAFPTMTCGSLITPAWLDTPG